MEHKRQQRLLQSVESLSNRQFKRFHFTFGVSWSREDVVRAVVDMEYVTSNELGRFTVGFVLDVKFTYVVGSVQHIAILLNMFNVPEMTYPTVGPG